MDNHELSPGELGELIQAGSLGFRLDWEAYFDEFCRRNGGSPVLINVNGKPRFLFRTGWMYANNHQGPEYTPPEDPIKLDSLLRFYWRKRRGELVEIRSQLLESVASLEDLQRSRSVPLQVKELMWDDVQRKPVARSGDIHMNTLWERVNTLSSHIAECDSHLHPASDQGHIGE